mmetsp:Transcript_7236/g.13925  ORF Transcript_7236/g.13925 Transcript_7236/m.13925 type:complete len:241 (-) Transcript_7236:910-1632(-)
MSRLRNRVLPELRLRHILSQESRVRSHVTVTQLVPCLCKSIFEFLWVLIEAFGDFCIGGIIFQRQVSGEHDGCMPLCRIVRIRHSVCRSTTLGDPLSCSSGAFRLFPIIIEHILEVSIVPLNRVLCPSTLQATCDGVHTFATVVGAHPTQTHVFQTRTLWLWPHMFSRIGSPMCFPEGVPTCNQCHCLFVIHCHAPEGCTDVLGSEQGIWYSTRAFWVHIDEAHLHCPQGFVQTFADSAG